MGWKSYALGILVYIINLKKIIHIFLFIIPKCLLYQFLTIFGALETSEDIKGFQQ